MARQRPNIEETMAQRITVSLADDDVARIEVERREDESMGSAVRRLIGLGGWVAEQQRAGRQVYVEGDDGRPERVHFVTD